MIRTSDYIASTLLFVVFVNSALAKENACNLNQRLEAVKQEIASIKDYKFTSKVIVKGANSNIHAKIYGITPNFLRIDYKLERGKHSLKQKIIFDGINQWAESSQGNNIQVQKVQLAQVTSPKRPFDTYLYVSGTGLLSGEDFPGTMNVLLKSYDMKATCQGRLNLILQGTFDKDQFIRYLKRSKYYALRKDGIDRFASEYGFISMKFNENQLQYYEMGKSKEDISVQVSIHGLKINAQINKKLFVYKPPEDVEITDLTSQILSTTSSNN